MEDFPTKVTKVILSSESLLELTYREEVTRRWRISPFEFGSVEEYNILEKDSNYYFLRLVKADGGIYLSLSKGGKERDTDRLKRPMQIIEIPLFSENGESGEEFNLIGDAIDAVQDFVEEALLSYPRSRISNRAAPIL